MAPGTSPGERLISDDTTPSRALSQLQFNDDSTTVALHADPEIVTEGRSFSPSSSPRDTAASSPLDEGLRTPSSTQYLGLSSEGSCLLHHIFLGDPPPPPLDRELLAASRSESRSNSSAPERSTFALQIPPPPKLFLRSNAFTSAGDHLFQSSLKALTCDNPSYYHNILKACNLGISEFNEALHAYFDFPGLCRPFIPENAFWQDFHADRCGYSLLTAIACCGIPFTNVNNKWNKQRLLATMFRKELMQTMTATSRTSPMRLDELEAMALMVDFEYGSAPKTVDPSWKLFITHDALVLKVLQSRNRGPKPTDPSELFTQADERFTLLYWEVYCLDAFHSLNHQAISLIPDNALALCQDHLRYGIQSYFDAVLGLSIIARRIATTLCNRTAKATGIAYEDITMLHEQLYHWRNDSLPSELRGSIDTGDESIAETRSYRGSTPIPASRVICLRRAILRALEIKCYLQIDACVEKFGLEDGSAIYAEIITAKCLEVVLEARNLAKSIQEQPRGDLDSKEKPLIDCAPSILRNICADLCCWVCSHGKQPSESYEPHHPDLYSESPEDPVRASIEGFQIKRKANYVATANQFRNSVAAASSHRKTEQMVGHLDDMIANL